MGRAGFALMKMVGALGSFLGPALIGALADATGGFAAPCLVLGVCLAASAVLMLAFRAPGVLPFIPQQEAWAASRHRGTLCHAWGCAWALRGAPFDAHLPCPGCAASRNRCIGVQALEGLFRARPVAGYVHGGGRRCSCSPFALSCNVIQCAHLG